MIHKIKALHNEGAGLSARLIAPKLGVSDRSARRYIWVLKELNTRKYTMLPHGRSSLLPG